MRADPCEKCRGTGHGPAYVGYSDLAPSCSACNGTGRGTSVRQAASCKCDPLDGFVCWDHEMRGEGIG